MPKNKSKRGLYAGVDLGGTSLLVVVTDRSGEVLGLKEDKTPVQKGDPTPVVEQIARSVRKAADKAGVKASDLEGIGIGAAGAVDLETGVVECAPNLGWENVPLAGLLQKELGTDVFLDNDVTVAMIGEHELGAAKGARHALAIWVGTGIGGGLIIRGKVHHGHRGSAGEIGHTVIELDGPRCGCGRRGCAEALASRTAIEREVRAAAEAGRKSAALRIMDEAGKTRLTSSTIEKALAERDPVMIEIMERAQRALGTLVANLVNVVDPEVVVIGGGIAQRLGESFVGPIRSLAYDNFLQKAGREKVRIVASELGDQAGALGAAFVAMRRTGER